MTTPSMLDKLGLSADTDMIWTTTLAAVERKGYQIKVPPGGSSAKLGEGTYAAVFYSEHVQDKTPFAVKVFKDEDEDKLASFKREVKTLRGEHFRANSPSSPMTFGTNRAPSHSSSWSTSVASRSMSSATSRARTGHEGSNWWNNSCTGWRALHRTTSSIATSGRPIS